MRAWFEPLRLAQRKAQYGRRRATSRSFAYAGKGRQTRQIIQRNHSWHRLPLLVIGGHASTDAPHGSSSEHPLPRRATAACTHVRARVRACCSLGGPRHMRQQRMIIESTIRHAYTCMQEEQQQHIEANNSAVYCIQQGGSCLGWRLRAGATLMPWPSAMNVAMAWRYSSRPHACQPWQSVVPGT